ncbi:MAG: 50S ribosomal protein L29 [Patescibacteria group bacterium]
MKKDAKKELIKKNPKELQAAILEKRTALQTFRFAVAGSKARNVKEGQTLKRDIARIETLLTALKNK